MNQAARIKVWDLPTRLTHWLLAAAFAFAWWSAEVSTAEAHMQWHRWSGYFILGLVVFRLYWGLAGSESARFSHFLAGPGTVARYMGGLFSRDGKKSLGHNPMGGWSVVALLGVTLAIVVLGLFAVDVDAIEGGPLSDRVGFDLGRELAHWHDLLFKAALGLIALHLAAIAFYLLVRRENLAGAMVTGMKPRPEGQRDLAFAPLWRLVVGIALAAAVSWFVSKGLRV